MRNAIIILLLLQVTSCRVKEKEFDKSGWNNRDDVFYTDRSLMINDLILNHLQKGMPYKEVVDLIGRPEECENTKPNQIGYRVSINKREPNPDHGSNLIIELTQDSTIADVKIEKWKRPKTES